MNPPKSILDPSFKYISSAHTNLKETFERIRNAAQESSSERRQTRAPAAAPVIKLKERR